MESETNNITEPKMEENSKQEALRKLTTQNPLMKSKRLRKDFLQCFRQHLKQRSPMADNEKKLMRAVATNNTEAVEEMLRTQQVSANIADHMTRTPLHIAASANYKDMVEILLRYKADPNMQDIIGNTPLHLAACCSNIEIITMLLDAGTDISSPDRCGRNPLDLVKSKILILKSWHRKGCIEMTQLCAQFEQVYFNITVHLCCDDVHIHRNSTECNFFSRITSLYVNMFKNMTREKYFSFFKFEL